MKLHKLISVIAILASVTASATQPLRLSLQECRDMATANSETLRKADNAVRQADLDRGVATTAYLPKIDGTATGLYMLPDIDMMGSKMQMRGTYMAGFQLVQPIYAGGKITAGRKLARIGREAAAEQQRMTRMDVIADADNAYWTYIAVRAKRELMETFISMMDTLYAQTRTAVDAGMATSNDLLRIEAKRSELEYNRQKVQNGADLCRMALCNAIGVGFDTDIVPTDTMPECIAPGNPDTDILSRPEYHLLQKQLMAASEQVKMTRGDYLPTVGLSLSYTWYGNIKLKGMADLGGGNYMPYTQSFKDGIGMGMLAVSIPIFHWGEGVKKVRRAKIEVDNARLTLEQTSRLLELEARQAAANLSDGWAMIASARTAAEQAAENLRVMQNRYDEAMSPLTDLLDAQTQWQQSRSNMIEAVTQYQIYHTAWLRATGRL